MVSDGLSGLPRVHLPLSDLSLGGHPVYYCGVRGRYCSCVVLFVCGIVRVWYCSCVVLFVCGIVRVWCCSCVVLFVCGIVRVWYCSANNRGFFFFGGFFLEVSFFKTHYSYAQP